MDRFRFDDDYQKVYEYDHAQDAYIHCGSYLAFGLTPGMSYEEKAFRVHEGRELEGLS